LVKVPLKDVALLLLAPPVIEPVTVGTPQLYVVPAGIILPPTVVYEKGEPLQAVIGFAVMEGVGFTVIVTVNDAP
jgi:hypothetical protein